MDLPQTVPARELRESDFENYVPVHVVWEITLACDLKCLHCGSRAGKKRPGELTTLECLDVVDRLAELGTREVSLIGGEVYLRKDWIELVRAIRSRHMYCAIQTGGRNLKAEYIELAAAAGLNGIGVSIDGLAPLHDKIRGIKGSFDKAIGVLQKALDVGISTSVNTQIGPSTMADLPDLLEVIASLGVRHWQIQLAVPMGNAVDNDYLVLQPYQLLELMPLLAKLYLSALDRGVLIIVGNNVGYFGPYERLWRGQGDERVHWSGCYAGSTVLSIEANGTIKGCPSLPTANYAGGNIRELALEDIWKSSGGINSTRMRGVTDLWGYCKTCYYADVCRGGCTWMSHSVLGRPGNNPYCHYRALDLNKKGMREVIKKTRGASELSFSLGEYSVVMERILDGVEVANYSLGLQPISLPCSPSSEKMQQKLPLKLELCRSCNQYVHTIEITCPHCGADIELEELKFQKHISFQNALIMDVERLLKDRD
ncbi:GDL motif peptide-associated radical SAM/SPASM maturase [Pseudomonas asiatica]|uniref:GDL motif peptide-associated radical SAM/SPASM maturase n=1 Tax=Pseudomonas asiatica TaxID=2219225 RepID=UPI00345DCC99